MDNNDQILSLKQRVLDLEVGIKKLDEKLDRIGKIAFSFDQTNSRQCKILDIEMANAFDRIIHLELTLFPNLARDIRAVRNIIGEGGDRIDNPLDRRDK